MNGLLSHYFLLQKKSESCSEPEQKSKQEIKQESSKPKEEKALTQLLLDVENMILGECHDYGVSITPENLNQMIHALHKISDIFA